jgi:3-methyladenine DNA glycosylase AlkC
MDQTSLYDEDIYAWSEHQAEVLRRLASRRDLPNDLDLENIAEEIESVGRSQLNAVTSLLRLILVHLIEAWADPRPETVPHWASEVLNWRIDLSRTMTRAMRQNIELEGIWRDAVKQAQAKLLAHGRADQYTIVAAAFAGTPCPLDLDALSGESFDFIAAASALSGTSNGLEDVDLPGMLRRG